jgi:hypothetical protein
MPYCWMGSVKDVPAGGVEVTVYLSFGMLWAFTVRYWLVPRGCNALFMLMGSGCRGLVLITWTVLFMCIEFDCCDQVIRRSHV